MEGIEYSKQYLDDQVGSDSEDEQEKTTQEKEISQTSLKIEASWPKNIKTVLICERGNALALTKIIFDQSTKDLGIAETTYKEKTQKVASFLWIEKYQILQVVPESALKSSFIPELMDSFFEHIQKEGISIEQVLSLDS